MVEILATLELLQLFSASGRHAQGKREAISIAAIADLDDASEVGR